MVEIEPGVSIRSAKWRNLDFTGSTLIFAVS